MNIECFKFEKYLKLMIAEVLDGAPCSLHFYGDVDRLPKNHIVVNFKHGEFELCRPKFDEPQYPDLADFDVEILIALDRVESDPELRDNAVAFVRKNLFNILNNDLDSQQYHAAVDLKPLSADFDVMSEDGKNKDIVLLHYRMSIHIRDNQ